MLWTLPEQHALASRQNICTPDARCSVEDVHNRQQKVLMRWKAIHDNRPPPRSLSRVVRLWGSFYCTFFLLFIASPVSCEGLGPTKTNWQWVSTEYSLQELQRWTTNFDRQNTSSRDRFGERPAQPLRDPLPGFHTWADIAYFEVPVLLIGLIVKNK